MHAHLGFELLKRRGLLNDSGLAEFRSDGLDLRTVFIQPAGHATRGVLKTVNGGPKSRDLLGHGSDLRLGIGEILNMFGNVLNKLSIYSLERIFWTWFSTG